MNTETHTTQPAAGRPSELSSIFTAEQVPAEVAERAEIVALELAAHAGVRPVVMGHAAMELADAWRQRLTPLDGDGAPIVLLPRLSRWLVLKLGESDAIFVFSGRESAIARARALAIEQGVAFVALGPSGRTTDRMPASRTFAEPDFDDTAAETAPEPAATAPEPDETAPAEIRIEKQGRRYAVLVDGIVVATASNKQRALKKVDALRKESEAATPEAA